MLIFGKTKSDWKAIELYYRREWLCFVVGFIIGVILIWKHIEYGDMKH